MKTTIDINNYVKMWVVAYVSLVEMFAKEIKWNRAMKKSFKSRSKEQDGPEQQKSVDQPLGTDIMAAGLQNTRN